MYTMSIPWPGSVVHIVQYASDMTGPCVHCFLNTLHLFQATSDFYVFACTCFLRTSCFKVRRGVPPNIQYSRSATGPLKSGAGGAGGGGRDIAWP